MRYTPFGKNNETLIVVRDPHFKSELDSNPKFFVYAVMEDAKKMATSLTFLKYLYRLTILIILLTINIAALSFSTNVGVYVATFVASTVLGLAAIFHEPNFMNIKGLTINKPLGDLFIYAIEDKLVHPKFTIENLSKPHVNALFRCENEDQIFVMMELIISELKDEMNTQIRHNKTTLKYHEYCQNILLEEHKEFSKFRENN